MQVLGEGPCAGARVMTLLTVLALGLGSFAVLLRLHKRGILQTYSITGGFIIAYLLLVWLPAFYIYSQRPQPYVGDFLLAVGLVPPMVVLGVLTARPALRYYSRLGPAEAARDGSWHGSRAGTGTIVGIATALLASVALIVHYIREVPTVPLFALLDNVGNVLVLDELREEALKTLNSPFRSVYWFLRDSFFPLLVLISLAAYRSRGDLVSRILFWLTLAAALFYTSLTLARLPPLTILALVALFHHVYIRQLRTAVLALTAMAAMLPIFIFMYISRGLSGGSNVAVAIFERIFVAPANILYYYFEYIPYEQGLLHGRTLGKIGTWLGLDFFDISNAVYLHIRPDGLASGSANAAYIGSLYADFGYAGICIGTLLISQWFVLLDAMLARLPRTPLVTSAHILILYECALLSILPVQSTLVYSGLPLLIIVLVATKNRRWFISQPQSRSGLELVLPTSS